MSEPNQTSRVEHQPATGDCPDGAGAGSRGGRGPTRAIATAICCSAGGALLLALLGGLPAAGIPETGGPRVLALAMMAGFIGSLAGNVPALLTLGGPPARFMNGFFGGLAARFALTLGVGLLTWRLVPGTPYFALLVWVGAAQAVFLAVDTTVLLWLNRATTRLNRATTRLT